MSHAPGLDAKQAAVIADELDALTHLLSELAYDLGSDNTTLRKHGQSLQSFDLITQIHVALADVLRSAAPFGDRLQAISVQSLCDRMQARMMSAVN